MTVVARRWTVSAAEVARMTLEAAEIDAWLADDQFVAINWLNANAVGGVKVVVSPEDEDDAREVLSTEAVEIVGPDAPEPRFIEVLICPRCESEDVRRIPKRFLFVAIAVIVMAMTIGAGQPAMGGTAVLVAAVVFAFLPTHRCGACGARWTTDDVEPPPPMPTRSDLEATRCPRCGSDELYRMPHRRLRAASMFFNVLAAEFAALWLLLPKRRCENCRYERWW